MKKTILILFIATLFASEVISASDVSTPSGLTLTYSQKKQGRTISAEINTGGIRYIANVNQSVNGEFTLNASPFLCLNCNDTLMIGELNDSGLFSLLIDPMDEDSNPGGFSRNGNLTVTGTPSVSPVLSGTAVCLDNVDVIALDPMFNKASPQGFGVIGGTTRFFAGAMVASQNSMIRKQAESNFQVDWNNLGCGERMVFSMFGANAEGSAGPVKINSSAFLQNAWDMMLGGGTTLGWNVYAETGSAELGIDYRLGGVGVKLKKLGDDPEPQRVVTFSGDTGGNTGVSFSYHSEISALPSYRGTSQERLIRYDVNIYHDEYSICCRNTTEYGKDRGKVSKTVYTFEASDAEILGKTLDISLESTVNRMTDGECSMTDTQLKFQCDNVSLSVKNGKTLMTLSWEEHFDEVDMKISLNQDRQVTASLSFRDI